MKSDWLIKYNFSAEPKLQNLVENYYIKNKGESEENRIKNAEIMLQKWEKEFSTPILGVFPLYDYWYWIYIYSLDYHIDAEGNLYKHSWNKEQEVYIESFSDKDKTKDTILLDMMFEVFQTKWLSFLNKKNKLGREYILDCKINYHPKHNSWDWIVKSRFLSRQDSDYLIASTKKEVLSKLGFDSKKYTIQHISLEIFLQASSLGLWGNTDIMTHIDGYRLRADGVLSTIFAWHKKYGWVSYFDSFWFDSSFDCLLSRYMIKKI